MVNEAVAYIIFLSQSVALATKIETSKWGIPKKNNWERMLENSRKTIQETIKVGGNFNPLG